MRKACPGLRRSRMFIAWGRNLFALQRTASSPSDSKSSWVYKHVASPRRGLSTGVVYSLIHYPPLLTFGLLPKPEPPLTAHLSLLTAYAHRSLLTAYSHRSAPMKMPMP